jgi:RNA polymerase sigma factor (sigma-70 family)
VVNWFCKSGYDARMPDPMLETTMLPPWLARLRSGDPAVRDEIVRACQGRLMHLSRKMLKRNPAVQRWVEAEDVGNAAALRLLKALETTDVANTREFYNLAAAIIRRELIDLARHYTGPRGHGANVVEQKATDDRRPAFDPAAKAETGDLDRWTSLHDAVEKLPVEQREVFSLVFYHGWAHAQIADLFQVDERTIRRRFRAAMDLLRAALGGELPG